MKEDLVKLLACPACMSDLEVRADVLDGTEVMKGSLGCRSCDARYPVSGGVPRFAGGSTYADSFGYEWNRFRVVQLDSANRTRESETTFREKTGWTERDFCGALVLDAGVGAGRYAEVVSQWGAEVVGVDLTGAVDAAFESIGRRPRVHLVQADLFRLPFRAETFDRAYSIGVLHHTPAPERAFRCVAGAIKKGGSCAIYVYAAYGLARHASDLLRRLTTRLPLPVVYYASALAGPLYYLHRLPVLGRVCRTLLPISMHPWWRWRWLDTFDWYTPKYQWKFTYPQVFQWFKSAGFTEVEILNFPVCVRGVKGQAS